jgi:hypothetical protein
MRAVLGKKKACTCRETGVCMEGTSILILFFNNLKKGSSQSTECFSLSLFWPKEMNYNVVEK